MRTTNPKDYQLRNDVKLIITTQTGTKPTRIHRIKRALMNFVYLAQTNDETKYIVKFYPYSREFLLNYEPDLMNICHSADIRTPCVITDWRHGPKTTLNYMLYKYIEGDILSDIYQSFSETTKSEIAISILQMFKSLSSIPISGFGDLTSSHEAPHKTLIEFFKESIESALIANNQYIPARWNDGFSFALNHIHAFSETTYSSLAWSDASQDNIIIGTDNSIVGYIDFESALSCEPLLALGYIFAKYPYDMYFNSMLKNWESFFGKPNMKKLYLYSILRAARIAPHLASPLPSGHARENADKIFPGVTSAISTLKQLYIST